VKCLDGVFAQNQTSRNKVLWGISLPNYHPGCSNKVEKLNPADNVILLLLNTPSIVSFDLHAFPFSKIIECARLKLISNLDMMQEYLKRMRENVSLTK
jgi:hypothetical protein